ncbi:MAG: hypothetical protein WA741_16280 [Candidatus Sulfotelmatobacter sp.]
MNTVPILVFRIVRTRVAPVPLRFRYTVPCPAADHVGDRLFIRILSQQDERDRNSGTEKLGHKVNCLDVSRFMLEQDQAVAPLLHHYFGFLQRVSMVEVGDEEVAATF